MKNETSNFKIFIRNTGEIEQPLTFQNSISDITAIDLYGLLAMGCFNGEIIFYDLKKKLTINTINSGSLKTIYTLYLPSNNTMVVSNANKAITVWDLATKRILSTLYSSSSNSGKPITKILLCDGVFYCINTSGDLMYFKLDSTKTASKKKSTSSILDGFGVPINPKLANKKNSIHKIKVDININFDFIEQYGSYLYGANKFGYFYAFKTSDISKNTSKSNQEIKQVYYERISDGISCLKVIGDEMWISTYSGLVVYKLKESGVICEDSHVVYCIDNRRDTTFEQYENDYIVSMDSVDNLVICLLNTGEIVVYNKDDKSMCQRIKRKDGKKITHFCLINSIRKLFVVLENKKLTEFELTIFNK